MRSEACLHPTPVAEGAQTQLSDLPQQDLKRLLRQPDSAPQAPIATTSAQMLVATLEPGHDLSGPWQVRDERGQWLQAQRAHSCLVSPQVGDVVQLVRTASQCWVVAVLTSASPQDGVVLDAKGQRLSLQADELHLRASSSLHQEADISSHSCRLSLHTSQERQTRIHGTDSTRATHALTRVDKHHSVHAGNASLTASTLLKVDAAQIHMG